MIRNTTHNKRSIIPDTLRLFLKNRFLEFFGLSIIGSGVMLGALLATYSQKDASFNTLTSSMEAQNFLGPVGGYISDALLQLFGLASFLLAPLFVFWGVRLLFDKHIALFSLRLLILILFLPIVAFVTGELPLDWFPSFPHGGISGHILSYEIHQLSSLLHIPYMVFVLLSFSLSFVWFTFISTFPWTLWGRALKWILLSFLWGAKKAIALFRRPLPQKEEPPLKPAQEKTQSIIYDTVEEEPFSQIDEIDEKEMPIEPAEKKPSPPKQKIAPRHIMTGSVAYRLPPSDLLQPPSEKQKGYAFSSKELEESSTMLASVLDDFGVKGDITDVGPGPVVTLYKLRPAPGTKSSRVVSLSDDIARSMSAVSARIAVIPGYNAIGIELPNPKRQTVYIRELLECNAYTSSHHHLPLILGKDIGGEPIIVDLAKMPHLLVAGTTGSGKSVSINTMIISLLYALSPEQCKFIMIDPKMLELSIYDGIPHLLSPVVTDPHKAVVALKWAVREMEMRYQNMAKLNVRNIDGYNRRVTEAKEKGETLSRHVQTGFDPETGKPIYEEQALKLDLLPYIVVIVDEMADLMLVAGKDIEAAVQRLAQMARAAGIHLIMATQRPSVDVITGTIKANFPTRISFQVTSKIDSRTILGEQGAEQLLGQGDMLYMAPGGRVTRVHGPFISDQEVEKIVGFLKAQGEPQYIEEITSDEGIDTLSQTSYDGGGDDPLFEQALDIIRRERKASTSFVQRYLKIGYNRAASIIDEMEKRGIVSPANHVGKREVLIGETEKI